MENKIKTYFDERIAACQAAAAALTADNRNDEAVFEKIRMNVFKLNKILRGSFGACPYGEFLSINNQREIAKKESDLVRQDSVVSVLNTLLFFPLEYFGNAKGFYDKVIEMP